MKDEEKDFLDSDELDVLMYEYRLAEIETVDAVGREIKEFIRNNYTPRNTPAIEIDKDAIRFNFKDSNSNFSFEDLFTGNSKPDWQTQVMRAIKKAYDECVGSGKTGNEEDVGNEENE